MTFLLTHGSAYTRGHMKDPRWADISGAISRTVAESRRSYGSLRLELLDGPFGTDDLDLRVERGNCLVTGFHNISETDDEAVPLDNRRWKKDHIQGMFYDDHPGGRKHPMVDIGGYSWDATTVTTNVRLVKAVFKAFYRTGTFSHPWMLV